MNLLIGLEKLGNQRIETVHISTAIEDPPRDLILYQEEKRVKLYEDTIIKSNTMNRKEIFLMHLECVGLHLQEYHDVGF